MESSKNGRWIIPFKKFGMVRVKTTFDKYHWGSYYWDFTVTVKI